MSQLLHTKKAFLHLPGIGPQKTATFPAKGIFNWDDLKLQYGAQVLPGVETPRHAELLLELGRCEAALIDANLSYLSKTLHRSDHWRLLADFGNKATFLDIETSGDELRPEISVVVMRHQGQLHTFTAGQNLDQFLHFLNEIELLVTFNGASFDVPQLENHFHIPMRDIAHIDLRWVCYHSQLKGGLKEIERAIGLVRPPDLIGMDGAEAAFLWQRWKWTGNQKLVRRLARYCAADVIGLEHLSNWIVASQTSAPYPEFHWRDLPGEETFAAPTPSPAGHEAPVRTGIESRLRSRIRAMRGDNP